MSSGLGGASFRVSALAPWAADSAESPRCLPEGSQSGRILVYAPVPVSRGVEPQDPEHPGGLGSREEFRDLGRFPRGRGDGRLGNQDWIPGEAPYRRDGVAEQGGEALGRIVVVPVDPYPGDVVRTGPPG